MSPVTNEVLFYFFKDSKSRVMFFSPLQFKKFYVLSSFNSFHFQLTSLADTQKSCVSVLGPGVTQPSARAEPAPLSWCGKGPSPVQGSSESPIGERRRSVPSVLSVCTLRYFIGVWWPRLC